MFQRAIEDLVRDSWKNLLALLVKTGPVSVGEIVSRTGDSYMTVKTRCEELVKAGYLLRTRAPRPEHGRPGVHYSLAPAADALFPDGGGESILTLLDHARTMFGDHAPEKLLFRHFETMASEMAERLSRIADPFRRLVKFSDLRNEAGHVNDVEAGPDAVIYTEYRHPLAEVLRRYPRAAAMEHRAVEHALGMKAERSERPAGRGRPPFSVFAFSTGNAQFH